MLKSGEKLLIAIGVSISAISASIGLGFGYFIGNQKSTLVETETVSTVNNTNPSEVKKDKLSKEKYNNIIIYNAHSNESYKNGESILSVSKKIDERLKHQRINSNFIEIEKANSLKESYVNSKNILINKFNKFKDDIILDIHVGSEKTSNIPEDKIIKLVLAKDNPKFKENENFSKKLLNEIEQTSLIPVSIDTYEETNNFFNQDLSKNAISIEIGNENLSKKDIEECIDSITMALNNLFK